MFYSVLYGTRYSYMVIETTRTRTPLPTTRNPTDLSVGFLRINRVQEREPVGLQVSRATARKSVWPNFSNVTEAIADEPEQ